MKRILNKDFIYLSVLFIIFSVLFLLYGSYLHYEVSDIGREIYISSEIANGKVLYKDLFNIFAPMSYYCNALALKIFGNCFNTFFAIGAVNSLFALFPLYKIAKKYTNSEIALTTILLILFTCIFIPSMTNWITPYAYSMLYAMTFTIWALYFLLKYTDTNENKYIYYSSFLWGTAVSFKYDFAAFILLILFALIYKKANIKTYFKAAILTTVVPIITIIICFLNGNTIESMHNAISYIIATANSPRLDFFYKWAGIKPSSILFNNLHWADRRYVGFFWLGYSSLITLIIYIIKKQGFKYIFLNICVILISIKSIFFVNLSNYGTFSFPFLYINLICFFYNLYENSVIYKRIILSLIIIVNLIVTGLFINFKYTNVIENEKIDTNKGTIHIFKPYYYKNYIGLIKFIDKNFKENDKLLIIPEGVIYNYITDRESDGYLFYMIPNNLDVFSYDYYVNRLNEKNFEYIVVTSFWYGPYDEERFTNTFGKEIYENYILKEYDLVQTINNDFDSGFEKGEYLVYKKKMKEQNE